MNMVQTNTWAFLLLICSAHIFCSMQSQLESLVSLKDIKLFTLKKDRLGGQKNLKKYILQGDLLCKSLKVDVFFVYNMTNCIMILFLNLEAELCPELC